MRPDLIGERCKLLIGEHAFTVTVVAWHSNAAATVVAMDGRALQVSIADLRFPPRTEQPDEVKAAAVSLMEHLQLDDKHGRLAVSSATARSMQRLRKALDQ